MEPQPLAVESQSEPETPKMLGRVSGYTPRDPSQVKPEPPLPPPSIAPVTFEGELVSAEPYVAYRLLSHELPGSLSQAVTAALGDGWSLWGAPTYAGGQFLQAVVR